MDHQRSSIHSEEDAAESGNLDRWEYLTGTFDHEDCFNDQDFDFEVCFNEQNELATESEQCTPSLGDVR